MRISSVWAAEVAKEFPGAWEKMWFGIGGLREESKIPIQGGGSWMWGTNLRRDKINLRVCGLGRNTTSVFDK